MFEVCKQGQRKKKLIIPRRRTRGRFTTSWPSGGRQKLSLKLSPFYPGRHCRLRRRCSNSEHLQTLGQHRSGTRSLHPRPFGRGGSSHGMRGHCSTCPLIRQHKVPSITQFDFVNHISRQQPYRKIAVLCTICLRKYPYEKPTFVPVRRPISDLLMMPYLSNSDKQSKYHPKEGFFERLRMSFISHIPQLVNCEKLIRMKLSC